MRLKCLILFLIGCAMANRACAADPITLAETPSSVQKTIQAQVGGGVVGEIEKNSNGEDNVFDVGFTAKDGQEYDLTVDEDGTLLSREITFEDAPAPVQQSIQTLQKQGDLEAIYKNLDHSDVTYDVELTAKDASDKTFTIAEDGTLLSAEVSMNETPGAVQKAIQDRIADGKLESVSKNFGEDGVTYDVEMTAKNGREKGFTVAADGSLVSAQVELAEAPRPVQRTIRDKIGDGKVLRVDKSYVKEKGVFPYDVQGRKDGKEFDFIVGPRGRFLGMDE